MGYDKFGLDWNVWGSNSKKQESEDPSPTDTIGRGWNSSPDTPVEENEDDRPVPQKQQITCTLKNARFLPDESTDLNKPCKITVEVEGTPKGLVDFALHATYKGKATALN